MPKNLVYFGSPAFSAEILESILNIPEIRVVGVVTQPDKPVGRKQILTPSPVAQTASEHDLPTYKPQRLDEANLAHIKILKPDIFLVVSYGLFMPSDWLSCPTLGTYNVHFSLLPKYRGALCIQEAIKNQDPETGVTLMVMDKQMDHGPIISQHKVTIDPNDNIADLTKKLTSSAITLLQTTLPNIESLPSTPQDESKVIVTPSLKTLTHEAAFIPWDQIAPCLSQSPAPTTSHLAPRTINAQINSLNPQPGVWTIYNNQEIKILKTKVTDNSFEIETVQVPGKNPISWKQFHSGHK